MEILRQRETWVHPPSVWDGCAVLVRSVASWVCSSMPGQEPRGSSHSCLYIKASEAVNKYGVGGNLAEVCASELFPSVGTHTHTHIHACATHTCMNRGLTASKIALKDLRRQERAINQHPGAVNWMWHGSCLDSSDKRAPDAACTAHFLICQIIRHK